MEEILNRLAAGNDIVNTFVWTTLGLCLLLGTGVLMTLLTGCFQIRFLKHWWMKTVGTVLSKQVQDKSQGGAVSQFQALCTALAATVGTGNIAGVAAAIVLGGPGAIFWMWMAAFLGMMTNYSENVLGIYFRRKNKEGEWCGGAMYYLEDGLGRVTGYEKIGKILAFLFSTFTVLASFGIGNLGQVNKIVRNLENAFFANVHAPVLWGEGSNQITLVALLIGIFLSIVTLFLVVGGLKRIASAAEKLVPLMACLYILGCLILCICRCNLLPAAFLSIFRFAFGVKAVAGGVAGHVLKSVVIQGCKRGVYSNEAGLGSSVMVHSNSNVHEPVRQGLWGIFVVFADTIVICTITALVVLTSGFIDLHTGLPNGSINDSTLVADAFAALFGHGGRCFVAIAMLLFAYTTVLGWSHYASKAVEYMFGLKAVKAYRIFFSLLVILGGLLTSSLAWDFSDTANGLMMIPNLVGVLALSPVVVKLTRNYIARKINHENVEPLISYDPEIQVKEAEAVARGEE